MDEARSEIGAAAERWFGGIAGSARARALLQAPRAGHRKAFDDFAAFGLSAMLSEADSDAERIRWASEIGIEAGRALYVGPLVEASLADLCGMPADGTCVVACMPACTQGGLFATPCPLPYGDIADALIVAEARSGHLRLWRLRMDAIERAPRAQVDGTTIADPPCAGAGHDAHGVHDTGLGFRPADAEVLCDGPRARTLAAHVGELLIVSTSARLIGVADHVAAMTRDYMATRRQFGKVLGAFQVLQHRMVDGHTDVLLARTLLRRVTSDWELHTQRTALLHALKAFASRAAIRVAQDAVQLHGAMGFSGESDVGLYLKHALVLAARYGNERYHRARYAAGDVDLMS